MGYLSILSTQNIFYSNNYDENVKFNIGCVQFYLKYCTQHPIFKQLNENNFSKFLFSLLLKDFWFDGLAYRIFREAVFFHCKSGLFKNEIIQFKLVDEIVIR